MSNPIYVEIQDNERLEIIIDEYGSLWISRQDNLGSDGWSDSDQIYVFNEYVLAVVAAIKEATEAENDN